MNRLHISLNVANLEESQAFYASFLGTEPHKVRTGYANFKVDNPSLKLALEEKAPAETVGRVGHLGIEVPTTEDVEDAIERISAAGMDHLVDKGTTCCHAVQDKVWVSDPDGNRWEVYTITDDMASEKAQACC